MIEYKRTQKFTLLKKKEKEAENPQDMRQNEAVTQVETEQKQRRVDATKLPDKCARAKLGFKKGEIKLKPQSIGETKLWKRKRTQVRRRNSELDPKQKWLECVILGALANLN